MVLSVLHLRTIPQTGNPFSPDLPVFNIGIVFAHDGIHIGAALAVKGNIIAIPQVIPV